MNTHSNHEHGTASSGESCCSSKTPATTVGTVVDPVCGMTVDPATTAHHATHQGADHHFCSARCRERFIAEPQKYLSSEPKAAEMAAPAGTIYTCPMHPQIHQKRRVKSRSSGLSSSSRLGISGSNAMPQMGHVPGPSWRISGCIGQV